MLQVHGFLLCRSRGQPIPAFCAGNGDRAAGAPFPASRFRTIARPCLRPSTRYVPKRCGARPEQQRPLRRARRSTSPTASSISRPPSRSRRRRRSTLPARPVLLLVAVDGGRLGDALKYEVSRGGALFPHLYGPLDLGGRRLGASRCRSVPTAGTSFRSWSVMSAARPARPQAAVRVRSGNRARPVDHGAEMRPAACRPAAARRAAEGQRLRP